MENWDKNDVYNWLKEACIEQKYMNMIYKEEWSGSFLKQMKMKDLQECGIPLCQGRSLIYKRNMFLHEMKVQKSKISTTKAKESGDGLQINKANKMCKEDKQRGLDQSRTNDKNGSGGTHLVEASAVVLKDETEMMGSRSSSKHKAQKALPQVHHESSNCEIPVSQYVHCSPHPFDERHSRHRYIQGSVLPTQSRKPNYSEPVHEYNLFESLGADAESQMKKFCNEVFRFAGGCMNRRTNGTIHFGVGDKMPGKQVSRYVHGEVVGVQGDGSRDKFADCLKNNFAKYFEKDDVGDAKDFVRLPRFIEIDSQASITLNKHVIEVDIVPNSTTCGNKVYKTKQMVFADGKWKADKDHIFVRDGASTTDIWASKKETNCCKNFEKLKDYVQKWTKEWQSKEDIPKVPVKREDEGRKLAMLLTGGKGPLDNSLCKTHILVVNKATKDQLKDLEFVKNINWLAVLDFDPESAASGLCSIVRHEKAVDLRFPHQYVENNKDIETVVTHMHRHNKTSWIFCNGHADMPGTRDKPMDPKEFLKKRSKELRSLVQIICQEDITPSGKCVVVFLVLFEVQDLIDPIMETFISFYQEKGGQDDVMVITSCEESFESWKNIAKLRMTEEDVDSMSISRSSLQHVKSAFPKKKSGTISGKHYLCTSSGTHCELKAADEEILSSIKILCANECEGTAEELQKDFEEFRKTREEAFYRGDKVNPWNFYFAEKTGDAFIKRDQFDSLVECIESAMTCDVAVVKTVNIFHKPRCGGTTLAWHVLWHLKNKYRCAAVKDNEHNYQEIGKQVVKLLTYGESDPVAYTPVVLLIDDLEEFENVRSLSHHIRSFVYECGGSFETPVVIILNCMRSQNPKGRHESSILQSVHLKQELSANEEYLFEEKLKEIKKEHKEIETFLPFMIMKENFSEEYVQEAVGNILKGIERETKDIKLISYLALLNRYVKNSCISVSNCEALLGVSTLRHAIWGKETLEEGLNSQARLLLLHGNRLFFRKDEVNGTYESMRMNHPLVALQVLKTLKVDFAISQDVIAKDILNEDCLYDTDTEQDHFEHQVRSMMVTRQRIQQGDERNGYFSPLIEELKDYPRQSYGNSAKRVLIAATARFPNDAIIAQALARFCDIVEGNFKEAQVWGKKAIDLCPQNSYIMDTNGHIFMHELQRISVHEDDVHKGLSLQQLSTSLDLATTASHFFKQCQELAKKDDDFNISGFHGEVKTSLCFIGLLSSNKMFHKSNPTKKMTLAKYLKGECDLSIIAGAHDDEEETKKTMQVLKRHESYLQSLQSSLKENLEFLESINTFSKVRESEDEFKENMNNYTTTKYFNEYLKIFFNDMSEAKDIGAKYSFHIKIEKMNGDRFSGLYKLLLGGKAADAEAIVREYEKIGITSDSAIREKQNYVFACVILHSLNKKSKQLPSYQELVPLVKSVVKEAQQKEWTYPDPFFLGSIFFWPDKDMINKNDLILLNNCTELMRRRYRLKFGSLIRSRQPLVLFFLGKGEGLSRILPRSTIDKVSELITSEKPLKLLWKSGEIFQDGKVQDLLQRVPGVTCNEGQSIRANFNLPTDEESWLPTFVRPVSRGNFRRDRINRSVSFVLGFSLNGFLAYDVQPID
uniref:sterile alpha motif domain-containing protein 9-like n=1 Tax=Myxine glutinosa TaxID=7769 RepID=UPI00358F0FFA